MLALARTDDALSMAYIAAGAINENISINSDGTLSGAGGGQVQIGQLPGSVAVGQLTTNLVTALQAVVAKLSAISAELGNVVISEEGHLRSGQTAYDTGAGFWLGHDGSAPKFSIGNSSGNKLTWNGSTLGVIGNIRLTNVAQTFTPTWQTNFGTQPSGEISYIDAGAIVFMFTTAALTGTSNGIDPTFIGSGIPSAIRPSTTRMAPCIVINNNVPELGFVNIQNNGDFTLYRALTTSGAAVPSASSFSHTNTKGLPDDWLVVYAK